VGEQDEIELVEAYLKANSLTALYDSVFIPVITRMETDYRLELLDEEQKGMVEQSLSDMIEDVGTRTLASGKSAVDKEVIPVEANGRRIYCLPARASRDELAGTMLAQLLRPAGFEVENAPARLNADELVRLIEQADVDVICISVVAPSTILHARYLCLKLRAKGRKEKIMVGLWGSTSNNADAIQRLQDSGADAVVTTFEEAVAQLSEKLPTGELDVAAVA
jgi:methylmalonyl-CoA mutase cobalamin-binding domain/chain